VTKNDQEFLREWLKKIAKVLDEAEVTSRYSARLYGERAGTHPSDVVGAAMAFQVGTLAQICSAQGAQLRAIINHYLATKPKRAKKAA
jgi:lactam utilization protein B